MVPDFGREKNVLETNPTTMSEYTPVDKPLIAKVHIKMKNGQSYELESTWSACCIGTDSLFFTPCQFRNTTVRLDGKDVSEIHIKNLS